ncbi:hypothetical protein NE237_024474 [Protea cynaroides]|uniref:Ribosomal protein S1 n=1 Tax=Protea cynaroides TaxID=273540 RepID=A0A9Q0GNA8_9MAGN|nr:hypothetical protein NE237_024474 [Protea cynaroides]
MQDEPTGVPINRATRFENKVGSLDVVAGESLIKEQILERFFIDLVAGESPIKERAAARFNDLVGSIDVVAGEPLLLLPRRFRQNRAWMELNKIWRTNTQLLVLRMVMELQSLSLSIRTPMLQLPPPARLITPLVWLISTRLLLQLHLAFELPILPLRSVNRINNNWIFNGLCLWNWEGSWDRKGDWSRWIRIFDLDGSTAGETTSLLLAFNLDPPTRESTGGLAAAADLAYLSDPLVPN